MRGYAARSEQSRTPLTFHPSHSMNRLSPRAAVHDPPRCPERPEPPRRGVPRSSTWTATSRLRLDSADCAPRRLH